jgi:hypothetical protein
MIRKAWIGRKVIIKKVCCSIVDIGCTGIINEVVNVDCFRVKTEVGNHWHCRKCVEAVKD